MDHHGDICSDAASGSSYDWNILISRRALIFNTLLAIVFLLVFKSWTDLAEVLGLFHIISYLPVPIAIWVLRKKISRTKYLFRMPLGRLVALLLFLFF